MPIPRADLEALVYGPIETAGIVITPERRIWSDNLPRENGLRFYSRMLRQLVNRNGRPCNGVYFHCIKGRLGVHSRIEEGNIRLDVLLNNTCFHRILNERFPNGLPGMETIREYSGMRMVAPAFVKMVERASGKMVLGSELGEGKTIKTSGPSPLDGKIPDLVISEILHGSRIIKIGLADRKGGIQSRIDGYRRGFQASITKYCYGYANNVFQSLELFFIDIEEFNNRLGSHFRHFETIDPGTLEKDLLNTFKSVYGSLPPWEQKHRYAAARTAMPDSLYKETLSELLDVVENPR